MTDDQSIAGIEARPGISIPYKTIFEQFEAAAQRAPANAFLCYPATASRDYYPEGLEQSYGDAYAIVMDLADRYRAAGYLHAGVEAADGRWGVRLWGRNVTNTYYWTSAVQNQDVNIRFAGRPATYGVSVSAKF